MATEGTQVRNLTATSLTMLPSVSACVPGSATNVHACQTEDVRSAPALHAQRRELFCRTAIQRALADSIDLENPWLIRVPESMGKPIKDGWIPCTRGAMEGRLDGLPTLTGVRVSQRGLERR